MMSVIGSFYVDVHKSLLPRAASGKLSPCFLWTAPVLLLQYTIILVFVLSQPVLYQVESSATFCSVLCLHFNSIDHFSWLWLFSVWCMLAAYILCMRITQSIQYFIDRNKCVDVVIRLHSDISLIWLLFGFGLQSRWCQCIVQWWRTVSMLPVGFEKIGCKMNYFCNFHSFQSWVQIQ